MALTKKQLRDVCLMWSGTTQCRYLDEDDDGCGNTVDICKKLSPLKDTIDEEVDLFLADMQKNGQDPTKQGVPIGDNCKGYVVFKAKAQGYDVKP